MKEKGAIPIDTLFIDNSPIISPFMNSNKSKNGIDFSLNPTLEFLGRSGVREFNNLRIAFISGIDSDILGDSVFYNK